MYNGKEKYNEIISEIDIEKELADRNIRGKITSNNLMILCPFHNEKNASFGISVDGDKKGVYQCFSCGESGNFFHLISYLDDITFEEAISSYEKDSINVAEIKKLKDLFVNKLNKTMLKQKMKIINLRFLERFKKPYGKFLDYIIEERKLNKKTIEKFNILCCDTNYDDLKWKNRVIIPWYDLKGRLITIDARKIYEKDKIYKIRKIKNSDSNKVLFGLNFIERNSTIIIVEGSFDAMYLQQNNISAVALGTSSISDYQIKLLLKHTNNIVLSFDGDIPYYRERNMTSIKKYKDILSNLFNVEIVKLKNNRDPNDLSSEEIDKIYCNFKRN